MATYHGYVALPEIGDGTAGNPYRPALADDGYPWQDVTGKIGGADPGYMVVYVHGMTGTQALALQDDIDNTATWHGALTQEPE